MVAGRIKNAKALREIRADGKEVMRTEALRINQTGKEVMCTAPYLVATTYSNPISRKMSIEGEFSMSDERPKDSWDTDSGLPSELDFYITRASYGYRQEYMDGEVALLIWDGSSPDEDVESIIFPCGSGWEVTKGGDEVKHPKRTRFVRSSILGRLINRVVVELGVDMRSRGPATRADVWAGLGFHMKREELEYGPGILEDRGGKTSHLMPVAVLEKPAKGKPKAETKPETKPSTEVLEKKLELLASKLSKEDFQAKAMDMPSVVENDDLLASILDDSEDGFWARHHK